MAAPLHNRNNGAWRFGTNAPRLKRLEDNGTLPAFDALLADSYYVVLEVVEALRAQGWSPAKMRRAFATIRSNNFSAGSRGVWARKRDYILSEVVRIWPELSQEAREEWIQLLGEHPAEAIGKPHGAPPWEEEED